MTSFSARKSTQLIVATKFIVTGCLLFVLGFVDKGALILALNLAPDAALYAELTCFLAAFITLLWGVEQLLTQHPSKLTYLALLTATLLFILIPMILVQSPLLLLSLLA